MRDDLQRSESSITRSQCQDVLEAELASQSNEPHNTASVTEQSPLHFHNLHSQSLSITGDKVLRSYLYSFYERTSEGNLFVFYFTLWCLCLWCVCMFVGVSLCVSVHLPPTSE